MNRKEAEAYINAATGAERARCKNQVFAYLYGGDPLVLPGSKSKDLLAMYSKRDAEITNRMWRRPMAKKQKKEDVTKLSKRELIKRLKKLESMYKKLESEHKATLESLYAARKNYDNARQELNCIEAAMPMQPDAMFAFNTYKDATLVGRIKILDKVVRSQGARLGRALTLVRQFLSPMYTVEEANKRLAFVMDGKVPAEGE